jgi:hypothetical protein
MATLAKIQRLPLLEPHDDQLAHVDSQRSNPPTVYHWGNYDCGVRRVAFVIDTNQALKVRAYISEPIEVTLAPNVIAEILLRTDPRPTLSGLMAHRVRYGLDLPHVFEELTALSKREIAAFPPFAQGRDHNKFNAELVNLSVSLKRRARRIKESNRRFCGSMFQVALQLRKTIREKGMKVKKCESISEAFDALRSFHEDLVVSSLTNGRKRRFRVAGSEVLYTSVMENVHLSTGFKALLFYILSWSRLWADQTLNYDPASNRDDWTDLTVAFYAADGDTVVTEDRYLQRAIKTIEPSGRILVRGSL